MKQIGRERLDINRAAVGGISSAFGIYMLMKTGIDFIEAITPVMSQQVLGVEDVDPPAVTGTVVGLGIATCATVFGQVQLALCVTDTETT